MAADSDDQLASAMTIVIDLAYRHHDGKLLAPQRHLGWFPGRVA